MNLEKMEGPATCRLSWGWRPDSRRCTRAWGRECEIVAPSLIPQRPPKRRKNAEELARLYRAGELVTIRVPSEREGGCAT